MKKIIISAVTLVLLLTNVGCCIKCTYISTGDCTKLKQGEYIPQEKKAD